MTYFQNIHSLAELKKQYRTLALANHPDKGGSTQTMQQINDEFARLYEIWKNDTSVSAGASGYEGDYAGATAQQYADYVYNKYRWTGSNYKGQHVPEIVELVRQWLKETYPRYKFSVRRSGYNSIHISLMQADFEAFTAASKVKTYADINHYHIESETDLTDRAREVMANVCAFVQSYNFDDSDPMTDYFCTNFYLNLSIGTYKKPYRTSLPKLPCRKGDEPPVFKHPEGPAHKAIRQALDGARFGFFGSRSASGRMVLGTDSFRPDGKTSFWPKEYSSAKTAQKRIDKLSAAGICCRLTGYNGGHIEFLGYTEETRQILEQERAEYLAAYRKWQEAQQTTNHFVKPSAEPNLFGLCRGEKWKNEIQQSKSSIMSKMTVNGISVCPQGEERYEYFTPAFARRTGKRYCQYDYRHTDGELFSCVAPTLDKCREKRNEWIKKRRG